jgi:5-methylcytosine-specific restriction endonuclease McrA
LGPPAPKNPQAGGKVTPATKRDMKEANRKANGGVLRDDRTGEELVDGKKHQKGVTPPDNEAHIDHVEPKSKGGSNAVPNLEVRSRKNNIKKSDKDAESK